MDKNQLPEPIYQFIEQHPDIVQIVIEFMNEHPELSSLVGDMIQTYLTIVNCFDKGGKLFLCGNGGSFADCLHISGEMLKSYERKRGLTPTERDMFANLHHGELLADALERGFPAIVLGLNHSLKSAVENDILAPYIGFAQELYALGRKGDVLLGISTGGNAKNVAYAVTTAKAIGMKTIGLTGHLGGMLAQSVDIPIRVPKTKTNRIQEQHQFVYHALCSIIEAHYFQELK